MASGAVSTLMEGSTPLMRFVADAQKVHVSLGIGRTAPLMCQIGFVPQLIVRDAALVALSEDRNEVAEVGKIRRRRFRRCAGLPGPRRGAVDADDKLEVKLLGKVDDFVKLLPGRLLPGLVEELTLAVLFDLFPGELLLNPLDAGVAGHLKGLFFFPELDLFVQKGIGAPRIDARFGNCALDVRFVIPAEGAARCSGK